MVNMRILIRIVFVIFIANGIDCLGGVCDNCCDCLKKKDENKEIKEYEEIKEEGKITAKSLVNNIWYNAKKNKPVLKIFKKKDDNVSPSTENGDKISFKLDESNKLKKTDQNENEDELKLENKLNLGEQTYALFEIKPKDGNTVYLYCSDVESSEYNNEVYGIFKGTNHVSISVIACDTKKITNVNSMFLRCSSLTELDLQNFNTTNVKDIGSMFNECSRLTELDLQNFNTANVTDMSCMFFKCYNLTKLDLKSFNTTKVKDMGCMFSWCSNLKELYHYKCYKYGGDVF